MYERLIMGEGKLLFSFPQAPIFSAFSRNREFRCLRAATRGSASGLRDLFEKRSIKNFNDNPIEVSRQTERNSILFLSLIIYEVAASFLSSHVRSLNVTLPSPSQSELRRPSSVIPQVRSSASTLLSRTASRTLTSPLQSASPRRT